MGASEGLRALGATGSIWGIGGTCSGLRRFWGVRYQGLIEGVALGLRVRAQLWVMLDPG